MVAQVYCLQLVNCYIRIMGGEFLPKLKMSSLIGSNPFLCCGHPRRKDKTPLDESIFPAMLLIHAISISCNFLSLKWDFPKALQMAHFLAASMYMVTTFEEQREGLLVLVVMFMFTCMDGMEIGTKANI